MKNKIESILSVVIRLRLNIKYFHVENAVVIKGNAKELGLAYDLY